MQSNLRGNFFFVDQFQQNLALNFNQLLDLTNVIHSVKVLMLGFVYDTLWFYSKVEFH